MGQAELERLFVIIFKFLGVAGPLILTIVLLNPRLKAKYLPQRTFKDPLVVFLIIMIVATILILAVTVIGSLIKK